MDMVRFLQHAHSGTKGGKEPFAVGCTKVCRADKVTKIEVASCADSDMLAVAAMRLIQDAHHFGVSPNSGH